MNLDTLIEAKRVGEDVIPVVDLRSLHKLLEVKRKFADWAKDRVKYYKEGEHYVILTFNNPTIDKNGKKRAPTSKEYYVSLEIAKLLERDEKAMKIINSFSKVEVDLSGSILSYKDGGLYITSLAIASLTGKDHFNVLRDIREETLKLQEEIDLSKSGLISGNEKEPLAYKASGSLLVLSKWRLVFLEYLINLACQPLNISNTYPIIQKRPIGVLFSFITELL